MSSAASSPASESMDDSTSDDSEPTFEPTFEPPVDWRERAVDAAETTKAWIVEHPLAALGIAVASGFVVGRMVRR